ncbi:hypothetical protein FGB62_112g00 [Gracilaria domingensis]|nr:hypothetical protein FGB62_112g00 [Gracilaria domingensis]
MRKENRFRRRSCFRIWRRVSVEAAPGLVRDRIFYAPDEPHDADYPSRTPTQFIKGSPDAPNVVRQGDEFEISFVGMNVSPQDLFRCNYNELFLYSLTNGGQGSRSTWAQRIQSEKNFAISMENGYLFSPRATADVGSPRLQKVSSLNSNMAPLNLNDVPFIHYDPLRHGRKAGTEPNSYVTIPASRGLYKQFRSQDTSAVTNEVQDASVRFNVMDLDNINDDQLQVISGITQLGDLVEKGAVVVPYAELISNAFEAVAAIGKRGLQRYSVPDQVFSVDMQFRLGKPVETDGKHESGTDKSEATATQSNNGNYLRYGYYYFLEKSVDAKLYSQTRSSAQYTPLQLRRTDLKGANRRRHDIEYFPLTNVSYVVMRVSRGCSKNFEEQKRALVPEHKKRLDTILQAKNISNILKRERKTNRRQLSGLGSGTSS